MFQSINVVKRQSTECFYRLAYHLSDKGLIFRLYKNSKTQSKSRHRGTVGWATTWNVCIPHGGISLISRSSASDPAPCKYAWETANDGSGIQVPATCMGDPDGLGSWFLASAQAVAATGDVNQQMEDLSMSLYLSNK